MKYYTKKPNGRYEEIGQHFEGFPADGWWFVADGTENLVVPIAEPKPLEKLQYLQYKREIVDRLLKAYKQTSEHAISFLVEKVLSELEEIVNKKKS